MTQVNGTWQGLCMPQVLAQECTLEEFKVYLADFDLRLSKVFEMLEGAVSKDIPSPKEFTEFIPGSCENFADIWQSFLQSLCFVSLPGLRTTNMAFILASGVSLGAEAWGERPFFSFEFWLFLWLFLIFPLEFALNKKCFSNKDHFWNELPRLYWCISLGEEPMTTTQNRPTTGGPPNGQGCRRKRKGFKEAWVANPLRVSKPVNLSFRSREISWIANMMIIWMISLWKRATILLELGSIEC